MNYERHDWEAGDLVSTDLLNNIEEGVFKMNKNYEKQHWVSGDVITSSKLNHIEDGIEAAGPAPSPSTPPIKGELITFGGHTFRVLKSNGWDIEVLLMPLEETYIKGLTEFQSKYSSPSPSQDPTRKTTFICGDKEIEGLKYEDSDLDTFCNETFFNTLPEDVQDAIIEQDIVQDIYYASGASIAPQEEPEADIICRYIDEHGWSYRWKIVKASTESNYIGKRKVYNFSCNNLYEYLGFNGSPIELTDKYILCKLFYDSEDKFINVYSWLASAYCYQDQNTGQFTPSVSYACYVNGYSGGVYGNGCLNGSYVAPTFHINLSLIEWHKKD